MIRFLKRWLAPLDEAQRRVGGGASDRETVALPFVPPVRIEGGPEGTVTVTVEEGGEAAATRFYPARDAPAPGYPEDLPFLPGVETAVADFGTSRAVTWIRVADPAEVEARVVALLEASGWTRRAGGGTAFRLLGQETELEREGRVRRVERLGGFGIRPKVRMTEGGRSLRSADRRSAPAG